MAQKLFSQDEKYITKGLGGSPTALVAYIFVTETTETGDVVLCGAGASACGVVDAAYAVTDERVRVCYSGITYVLAADTVAVGGLVAADSAGKAVPYAVGDYCLGRAMSAGVSGSLMSVWLSTPSPIDTIE